MRMADAAPLRRRKFWRLRHEDAEPDAQLRCQFQRFDPCAGRALPSDAPKMSILHPVMPLEPLLCRSDRHPFAALPAISPEDSLPIPSECRTLRRQDHLLRRKSLIFLKITPLYPQNTQLHREKWPVYPVQQAPLQVQRPSLRVQPPFLTVQQPFLRIQRPLLRVQQGFPPVQRGISPVQQGIPRVQRGVSQVQQALRANDRPLSQPSLPARQAETDVSASKPNQQQKEPTIC